MSKNSRAPRAKSGTSLRPLGALRLSQGAASQHSMPQGPTKNDPALLIHQLHTLRPYSPPNQLLKEKEREYKEKEQKLRDRISSLEKLVSELKFELKTKSDICDALKVTLDKKIEYYDGRLADAKSELECTREKLLAAEEDAANKDKRIDSIIKDYEKRMEDMKKAHEQEMKKLREAKDLEIKERDEKMEILKARMAETIGKNSSERQQQLEELKRDLIKASQEARELHKQLKYLQTKPRECSNCATLAAQLEQKTLQVRLKEKTINDLQNIGKSMQLQLHQQDIILTKWEEREERGSSTTYK